MYVETNHITTQASLEPSCRTCVNICTYMLLCKYLPFCRVCLLDSASYTSFCSFALLEQKISMEIKLFQSNCFSKFILFVLNCQKLIWLLRIAILSYICLECFQKIKLVVLSEECQFIFHGKNLCIFREVSLIIYMH